MRRRIYQILAAIVLIFVGCSTIGVRQFLKQKTRRVATVVIGYYGDSFRGKINSESKYWSILKGSTYSEKLDFLKNLLPMAYTTEEITTMLRLEIIGWLRDNAIAVPINDTSITTAIQLYTVGGFSQSDILEKLQGLSPDAVLFANVEKYYIDSSSGNDIRLLLCSRFSFIDYKKNRALFKKEFCAGDKRGIKLAPSELNHQSIKKIVNSSISGLIDSFKKSIGF